MESSLKLHFEEEENRNDVVKFTTYLLLKNIKLKNLKN